MENMNSYWEQEFRNAYGMLLDMLYKAKGYSYSDEIGSGGMNFNMQMKLIEIKADIETDKRKDMLRNSYRYYAILIYGIIGVK